MFAFCVVFYFLIAIFTMGLISDEESGGFTILAGAFWPISLACFLFFALVSLLFSLGQKLKEVIEKIGK